MNPLLSKIITNVSAKVSPANRKAFKQAVIAGQKIMFDPKTHANMELVKNPASRDDPVNTISKGVTGLVWIMFKESRETMKPEVMVFSGVVLMCHAFDFAERAYNIKITPEMISKTTQMLAENLFKKMGVTPEQLQMVIDRGAEEISAYQSGALTPEMVRSKMQGVPNGG